MLLRVLLLRGLRFGVLLLRAALLQTTTSSVEAGVLADARMVLLGFIEGILGGHFLAERRAVELEQALDFIVGIVLVINVDKFLGDRVYVKFLLIAGNDG